MIEKVYYWKNGNGKLVPVIKGDRKCGNEIEVSNFHSIEKDCNEFKRQIEMKITSGLEFCNGFNLETLIELCNNGEIYYV